MAASRGGSTRPPLRNARGRSFHGGTPDRWARGAGLLEFLSIGRCAIQCRRSVASRDANTWFAHHARGRQTPCTRRVRAGRGPRGLLAKRDERGRLASQHHVSPRKGRSPACRRVDHCDGTVDGAATRDSNRRGDRRGRPRLLRRVGPDRLRGQHRYGCRLEGVALGQGQPERRWRGLHQLPNDQGRVSCVSRGSHRGRKNRIQGMGVRYALFRGVYADRSDGRARRRHAAVRPHEASRPRQSENGPLAVGRCAASSRQCTWHFVEYRGFSDQAETRRAGAGVPDDPGPAERRVCTPGRLAPQYVHKISPAARPDTQAEVRAAHPVCRPDHGLRRLSGKCCHWLAGRALRRRRSQE